ncbi:MAG: transporter substrate-binding domain-containing protein [Thiolinea sp.]
MKKTFKKLSLLAASALLAMGVSTAHADAQQDIAAASVIESIKKAGTLRVGMSTFVPWAMRDKKGELIGFEIDVATKVAEDMGVKLELVPTEWAGIIPALIAKKFDLIIGGMSITPKRNLTVNFTAPYAHSGMGWAASKEKAADFKMEDFNSSDVTFTCRRGATSCTDIKKLFPKAQIRQFDDDTLAFQEVLNGAAHATLSSAPKPQFMALKHPEKLYVPEPRQLTKANEGMAMRKGDPDALNFLNNWILVHKANGWLQERHNYWFGTRDWADQVPE